MREHLTGPLQGGAVESRPALSATGTVTVGGREPLLLAVLTRSLDDTALTLTVTRDDPGHPERPDVRVLEFAAGTEAGAALPAHRPPVSPDTGLAGPVELRLSLVRTRDGQRRDVPAEQVAEWIEPRLVEGVLGRLLYVLGAEKARLRRQARELARVRALAGARDDALDRLGAELGVLRLLDTVRFRPPPPGHGDPVFDRFRFGEHTFGPGVPGQVVTEPRREPDDEYRRRLAIYRPWLRPTPSRVREVLGDGRAAPHPPGTDLLGGIGIDAAAVVTDTPRAPAVAVHLVTADAPELRAGFSKHLQATTLIWPGDDAEASAVHAARYLPSTVAEADDALRRRLRGSYELAPPVALAPGLARALDQVGRARRALGATGRWRILRGQDVDGGSRYELGLGADLARPDAAELDELAARLRAGEITPPAPTDDEPDPAAIRGLLAAAVPADAAADPDGAWLLEACGLRTVHRVDDDVLYVSHVPTFGLTVGGPAAADEASSVTFDAHYHAAGEPGSHVLVVQGLAAAAAEWAELGRDPWQVLDADAAASAWTAAIPTPEPAARVLGAVGLPAVADPAAAAERLAALPGELIATLRLAPTTARRITAGRPDVRAELRELVGAVGGQGMSSALPLVLGDEDVVLVVGGIGLPLAGLNLAERIATLFRWHASRIWPVEPPAAPPTIRPTGAVTTFTAPEPGLYAVVVFGRIRLRTTGVDPYEFSVDLPADATLTLPQYEYLMNLLDHVRPMGTRVDTWSVRRHHVDLDGDDIPEPLAADVSRTFRRYRRSRSRGRTAVDPTLPPALR
jgi:hypothetical protein